MKDLEAGAGSNAAKEIEQQAFIMA